MYCILVRNWCFVGNILKAPMFEILGLPKGQLISKGLFGVFNSSKKRTKKFDQTLCTYYDTSGRIVFVHFLKEFEDTKKTF